MAAIAARVGGSKATLYNYFASKEELFASLVAQEGEIEAASWRIPECADDMRTRLREIGESFMRIVTNERSLALHRLVIAESARFPELGRLFFEAGPGHRIALLAAILEDESRRGRLRVAAPPRAAAQFLELCKSSLHQKLLWNCGEPPTREEISDNVAAAVEVFLAAYGAGRR